MFTVYLTNFGYSLDHIFGSREEAIEAARATGFECTVHRVSDRSVVATVTPLGGTALVG